MTPVCGLTCLTNTSANRTGARELVTNSWVNSSSDTVRGLACGPPMPALTTTRSKVWAPSLSRKAATDLASAVSTASTWTRPPEFSATSFSAEALAGSRAVPVTSQPRRSNSPTRPRPMPREAPTMRAVWVMAEPPVQIAPLKLGPWAARSKGAGRQGACGRLRLSQDPGELGLAAGFDIGPRRSDLAVGANHVRTFLAEGVVAGLDSHREM